MIDGDDDVDVDDDDNGIDESLSTERVRLFLPLFE